MTADIPTPEQVYLDAGRAMAAVDPDDEEPELYEWHQCSDQPNCRFPRGCPCAGKPYPSEVVRAGLDSAFTAGVRQEREHLHDLLKPYVHSLEQIAEGPWSNYLDGRAASLAWLIRRHFVDVLEASGAPDSTADISSPPPTFSMEPVPGRPGVVRPVLSKPVLMDPETGAVGWGPDEVPDA